MRIVITIVMKEGKPWLVTGTPGGSTIITSVVQVIVNMIDHGMNVAEATHQPFKALNSARA